MSTLCQIYWNHFSNNIYSLHVSASHLGNSHNISSFLIIILFIMVTCDQWSLMYWRFRWWLAFFINKLFLKLRYMLFFRHTAIVLFIKYKFNFLYTGKLKQLCDLLNCHICFVEVVWNWIPNISEVCLCVD